MDKPTARDMPKLKTQLPDPLLILSFTHDDLGNVFIEARYATNTPSSDAAILRGQVHQPILLMTGLARAIKGAHG